MRVVYSTQSTAKLSLDRAVAQAVTGFQRRRLGFELGSGQVGFVVDKAALRRVFSKYLSFSCQAFHRPLHTHYHPAMVQ
jgi:hypothetical protein